MELIIFDRCGMCNGKGVFVTTSHEEPQIIDPCPSCNGVGYHEDGKAECAEFDDVRDTLNDIMDKLKDIKEKLDEV